MRGQVNYLVALQTVFPLTRTLSSEHFGWARIRFSCLQHRVHCLNWKRFSLAFFGLGYNPFILFLSHVLCWEKIVWCLMECFSLLLIAVRFSFYVSFYVTAPSLLFEWETVTFLLFYKASLFPHSSTAFSVRMGKTRSSLFRCNITEFQHSLRIYIYYRYIH